MNNQEKAMKCGKIAHDIMNENLLLKNITRITKIWTSDDLYRSLVVDRIEYGIFSRKTGGKITMLPKFLLISNNGIFTPFDYLVLHFISKYTTVLEMGPALLPPPKIYMKKEKSCTIKELIEKIGRLFKS